jgi:hypothetical protein
MSDATITMTMEIADIRDPGYEPTRYPFHLGTDLALAVKLAEERQRNGWAGEYVRSVGLHRNGQLLGVYEGRWHNVSMALRAVLEPMPGELRTVLPADAEWLHATRDRD